MRRRSLEEAQFSRSRTRASSPGPRGGALRTGGGLRSAVRTVSPRSSCTLGESGVRRDRVSASSSERPLPRSSKRPRFRRDLRSLREKPCREHTPPGVANVTNVRRDDGGSGGSPAATDAHLGGGGSLEEAEYLLGGGAAGWSAAASRARLRGRAARAGRSGQIRRLQERQQVHRVHTGVRVQLPTRRRGQVTDRPA